MNRDLKWLQHTLELLEDKMKLAIEKQRPIIDKLHPAQKMSAENLIQYLVFWSEDVRSLQEVLHMAGLSSLASSESHILRQLQAILERLGKKFAANELSDCNYYTGRELIQERSTKLFG